MGIYMLGLPIGLILAFFTVGRIVTVFGTWRAPFFIAMIPGVLFAILAFFIKEPLRGAAEATISSKAPIDRPLRKLLRIPTIWWIILAGVGSNFAAYSANGFLVPLFQRYFELPWKGSHCDGHHRRNVGADRFDARRLGGRQNPPDMGTRSSALWRSMSDNRGCRHMVCA